MESKAAGTGISRVHLGSGQSLELQSPSSKWNYRDCKCANCSESPEVLASLQLPYRQIQRLAKRHFTAENISRTISHPT